MKSISAPQLTFNFEPSLPERYGTLREWIAHRVTMLPKPQKTIAAEMDMAPSTLSRKLNPGEGDTSRFTLEDLESYLNTTDDAAAVIEYIAAKYCDSEEARKARVLAKVETMLPEFMTLLSSLKGASA